MGSRRIVGSSQSVVLNGLNYPNNLVDNPICAFNSAELPRIYGSGWTRKKINRLREEELFNAQSERLQREADIYKQTKRKYNYFGGSAKGGSGSTQRTTKPKPKHNSLDVSTSKASSHQQTNMIRKQHTSVQLPDLQQTFHLERRNAPRLIAKESRKTRTSAEDCVVFSPNKNSSYNTEHEMRSTIFSRIARRQKTQQFESYREQSPNRNHFIVPHKDSLPELIKNYVSMDVGFDMQEVMDSETFCILETGETLYIGEAEGSKPHGYGVLFRQKSIFEGIFHNGHKLKGVEKYVNGIYRGDYKNGRREGLGRFEWSNGEVYQGFWKNGLKHGEGRWHDNRGSLYQGDWKDNCQSGNGKFVYKGNTYAGDFVNFLKQGNGEQWFVNGDHYKGEYKSGKPHGKGKYTWSDGRQAIGTFVDGFHTELTITQYEKQESPSLLESPRRLKPMRPYRR